MLDQFNVRPAILLLPSKRKIENTLYSAYISLYRVGRDVPSLGDNVNVPETCKCSYFS